MRYVVPSIDLLSFPPARAALARLTESFCAHHGIVPVSVQGGTLIVATADPEDVRMPEEARLVTGLVVQVVRAEAEVITRVRNAAYGRAS